mmetsp:Transcript_31642/g.58315  ORF Transcript_31642/g.58315 Transcript_31642/m.58315 type:complete len:373 (-) Transcript_31642:161-1279(-)
MASMSCKFGSICTSCSGRCSPLRSPSYLSVIQHTWFMCERRWPGSTSPKREPSLQWRRLRMQSSCHPPGTASALRHAFAAQTTAAAKGERTSAPEERGDSRSELSKVQHGRPSSAAAAADSRALRPSLLCLGGFRRPAPSSAAASRPSSAHRPPAADARKLLGGQMQHLYIELPPITTQSVPIRRGSSPHNRIGEVPAPSSGVQRDLGQGEYAGKVAELGRRTGVLQGGEGVAGEDGVRGAAEGGQVAHQRSARRRRRRPPRTDVGAPPGPDGKQHRDGEGPRPDATQQERKRHGGRADGDVEQQESHCGDGASAASFLFVAAQLSFDAPREALEKLESSASSARPSADGAAAVLDDDLPAGGPCTVPLRPR